ncbi:MAG TPA: homoserine kinase [Chloroflexota bacterium]
MPDSIVVRAPATSANMGSGFDCLGLALDLWTEIEAVVGGSCDSANLIVRSAHAVFVETATACPGFELRSTNAIPLGRGLGSSAAAIMCGVLLANHCLGTVLGERDILDIASRLEGHPDNVAPCLLGGVQVATIDDAGHVVHARVPLGLPLQVVVFVPEQPLLTIAARQVLPTAIPLADAMFNVARSSLLVAALATGAGELIAEATRDRLHQPYRLPLFPPGSTLLEAAMNAGALGAYTSGAGPSVLALVADDARAQAVADAFDALAVPGAALRLRLSERGAHVVGA